MPAWTCLTPTCDAHGTGDNWAQIDKSAEKHTAETKHATATSGVGTIRRREGDGRVRNLRDGGARDA